MDPLAIVRERLWRQGLAGDGFAGPVEAVGWFGAVQGQEYAEAKWAVGQRVRGCQDADVEAALADGSLVRTHAMRPTWHLLAAEDLRWLMRLTAPRVHAANRFMYRQTGVDEPGLLGRSHAVLARALEGGEALTRPELAGALGAAGIEASGPRLAYIVMHAELELLICSGPRRGAQHTYMLAEGRVPPAVGDGWSREAALAELTRRYFVSHGPATERDFAWWSGLTLAEVREGIALAGDALAARVDADGARRLSAPSDVAGGPAGALLLGSYDEAVIAYKDLRIVFADGVQSDGLLVRPVVIDGRTVGRWKRTLRRQEVIVETTLFERLGAGERAALEAEAHRFGRFLGVPAQLVVS